VGIRILRGIRIALATVAHQNPVSVGFVGAVPWPCLHCPEMGAPFIGTWYLLGILIRTVLGALLGKTLLRW
jgi:hypothetical protein